MTKSLLPILAVFLAAVRLSGAEPAQTDAAARVAALVAAAKSLHFRTGDLTLPEGSAVVHARDGYRFLDAHDADTLLTQIWPNPHDPTVIGMIVPPGFAPFRASTWAITLRYQPSGYVKDDDAKSVNYDKLLGKMKDAVTEQSAARVKAGYPSMELVGWATPPRYDAASHKLYWAKELHFAGEKVDSLNYNIRVLGRSGVLSLNAIAHMTQLPEIEKATPQVLELVDFVDGQRYADFDASTDKIATFGLAALVAGGIAAKAGFFKLLLVGLLALKKFVIVGFAALATFFRKIWAKVTGQNKRPEPQPETT